MNVPPSLPRYSDSLPYGWVLGEFPVLELLRHAKEDALEVRWHGDLEPSRRRRIEQACAAAGVPLVRDDATVRTKRSKGTARVLAIFRKREASLRPKRHHLLLVRTRDPGNTGAMLRTALAFGIEDVALVGADPHAPHVARASLGAVFGLRAGRFADVAAYRRAHPDREAWFLHADAEFEVEEVPPPAAPRTVAAGPEWPGFVPADLAHGTAVRIDHDPRVESLNVAVAVGIALHRLVPRKRIPTS